MFLFTVRGFVFSAMVSGSVLSVTVFGSVLPIIRLIRSVFVTVISTVIGGSAAVFGSAGGGGYCVYMVM